jgi:hypothetical protein
VAAAEALGALELALESSPPHALNRLHSSMLKIKSWLAEDGMVLISLKD